MIVVGLVSTLRVPREAASLVHVREGAKDECVVVVVD
jgi:hypothetical protein